jgi:hypothetical protein
VTRPLAAILACVVGVLAVLAWGPAQRTAGLHAVADLARVGVPRAEGPRRPVTDPLEVSRGRAREAFEAARPMSAAPITQPTARVADDSALAVEIASLSPSVVPQRGPVIVRGTVTNTTDETWQGINVYPCTSRSPMTTAAELAAAADSDPELAVCVRTRGFVTIDELAPGQTARYSIRVPRDELGIPDQPGVYWFNVQALGASSAGRDVVSDGRARSFLPVVDRGADPVDTTLVVPIRRTTVRDVEGRVAEPGAWGADLAPGGRLYDVLSFLEGTGSATVAVLLDPAVPDAVRQLAEGNPPRDLAGPDAEQGADPDPLDEPSRELAQAWLDRFVEVAGDNRLMVLPYGDLDLAATARHAPALYGRSVRQSEAVLESFELSGTPTVSPPSGLISDAALALVAGEDPTVLLSSESLPGEEGDPAALPTAAEVAGVPVGVYDVGVATGGPGPNDRLAPVALRQRMLAEAAIRTLTGDERPLRVNLPGDFDPGRLSGDFFPGLDRPYVALGPLVQPGPDEPSQLDALDYPRRQEERELSAGNIDTALQLLGAGEVLDRLLPDNDTISARVLREALATSSYQVRDNANTAGLAARQSLLWITTRLAKVTISAPPFVILSSGAGGPFAVTVSNGLEHRVLLRILARTDGELVIRAPETIELEAGASRTINLSAKAGSIGVHPVQLVTTDDQGTPLGSEAEISIRSNEVGKIIWVVMGAGVGILFLAITVRLTRRVRRARAA